MKRHTAVILAVLIAGCDSTRSSVVPTAPSVATTPVSGPSPSPLPQILSGYVADTAFRVLAGVTVEVMQGPDAGLVMTSDAQGRFSYTGMFAGPVTLRATKEGYAISTETARLLTNGGAYVSFQLASLDPPVGIAGSYTLTISADPACDSLPDEARTKTYSVTVIPNPNSRAPANTSFNGTVTSGRFAPYGNIFWIGVAANYVAVSTEGEGPSIVEQIGPNKYVAFFGSAAATMTPGSSVSTLSAPFRGVIEYCELKAPIGAYYDCRPELAQVRDQCTSDRSQLTLVRR